MKLRDVKLPKKVAQCPIVEAVFEIRFTSKLPPEAVFGVAYEKFKGLYPNHNNLPILQLPNEVLQSQKELQFSPHYKLTNSANPFLQIGPRTISLVCTKEYPGWTSFSGKFREIIEKLKESGITDELLRFGLRYINFFEQDIFNSGALANEYAEDPFRSEKMSIRTLIKQGNYTSVLNISNQSKWTPEKAPPKKGSIIDIDTFVASSLSLDSIRDKLIEEGHKAEKNIFFSLLHDDFLKKNLKPEY